jgi:hypothetical protein
MERRAATVWIDARMVHARVEREGPRAGRGFIRQRTTTTTRRRVATRPPESTKKRKAASFLIFMAIGGVAISLSGLFVAPASAEGLGSWSPTTSYPYVIQEQSCPISSGYVYCVGGSFGVGGRLPTNGVYYASVSSSGVGNWTPTTSYPTNIADQPCVISSGYIYCIGGRWVPNHPIDVTTNAVYYASVSSSGVGIWTPTTSYPTNIAFESCVASSGYIYCVGGRTNAVYYAPLSASGVGTWTSTTDYPIDVSPESCVASSGHVYCVGGRTADQPTQAVYYAPLSASGVGTWSSTTSYPTNAADTCVASSGYIYCVGGGTNAVYYAPVSPLGVGTWSSTTSYPTNAASKSCVASSGYIYCVGGNTGGISGNQNAVYYAPISQPPSSPPPPPSQPPAMIDTIVTMEPESPDPSTPGQTVSMSATLTRADTGAPLAGEWLHLKGTDDGGATWWNAGWYATDGSGRVQGGVVFQSAGENQRLFATFEGHDFVYRDNISNFETHATRQSSEPPPPPPPVPPAGVSATTVTLEFLASSSTSRAMTSKDRRGGMRASTGRTRTVGLREVRNTCSRMTVRHCGPPSMATRSSPPAQAPSSPTRPMRHPSSPRDPRFRLPPKAPSLASSRWSPR